MHSLSNFNADCYYNATGDGQGGSNRGPGTLYNIPALLNMATKAWYRQYVDSSAVVPPTSLLGLMSMPKVRAGAKGMVCAGGGVRVGDDFHVRQAGTWFTHRARSRDVLGCVGRKYFTMCKAGM